MSVYEVTENGTKALAKAVIAIASPSAKVSSEVEFFVSALATVGVDFAELSPAEAIACQDVLFPVWQASTGRRDELDAIAKENEAKAAKARLEALEDRAERVAARIAKRDAAAKRDADALAELEELRAKFGA